MKTFEEIKTELLTETHNRQYELNGEVFDMTDAEFNEAIDKKAEMILAQEQDAVEKEAIRQAKISGYQKMGLTNEEIGAILGLTADDLKALGLG